ncbi:MAG: methyltransferase domain-containing protein [Polyangiaceae bacterium]|nr:methyltransferase domain-containing protein [Polyangiaceae bacterium]
MDLHERPDGEFLRHPWELARRELFGRVLDRQGILSRTASMLDVGAGDAWLSRSLLSLARRPVDLVCWDAGYEQGELDAAADRVTERPGRCFDLVLMLDVLEHVSDDRSFLSDTVERNVVPGGHLLFSVPAWQGLFSGHDHRLGHHRRYHPRAARELIVSVGLSIVRAGGAFHSLLPVRWVSAVVERLRGSPGKDRSELCWQGSELSQRAVTWVLTREHQLSLALQAVGPELPGLSWWALCQKPF